ncbi:nucleotidyltransferase family protein [uncultured Veillonella sp.]|uniref:tRNA(Met) cytidine acetate ligase n=1 Tax=uncultured Veillonella sp. TaxID=159268 RepID=UPI0025F8DBC2|nr:nucleotidyltransferase family protein [uncultured Veillonella sp.]
MKIIGIICEYNPFHNGHAHQLHTLASEYPDALRICIMSGSFVQRGEPALFSKFDRARWAILGGADVVIELPTLYSLGSAQLFGTGAVRLIKALSIDTLSFGSETTDLDQLIFTAKRMDCESTQNELRSYLKEGMSYGTAFRKALGSEMFSTPNALLGLEYIRAGLKYHPTLEYIPIQRTSDHHNQNIDQELPSGTALRQLITTTNSIDMCSALQAAIPTTILDDITRGIANGDYVDYSRYHNMVHMLSRRISASELERFVDFTEGIEHLWLKAAQHPTWESAINQIKSKRYTYARLQRMGAYLTLGVTKDLINIAMDEGPQYARLLAFNDRGRQWLRTKHDISLIQKWAKAPTQLNNLGKSMHHIDTLATDIQALCFHNKGKRIGHTDYTYTPQYIK